VWWRGGALALGEGLVVAAGFVVVLAGVGNGGSRVGCGGCVDYPDRATCPSACGLKFPHRVRTT